MNSVERYNLLSTFDISRINEGLGTNYSNLGEVFRAQSEAFAALSPEEVESDRRVLEADLEALERLGHLARKME